MPTSNDLDVLTRQPAVMAWAAHYLAEAEGEPPAATYAEMDDANSLMVTGLLALQGHVKIGAVEPFAVVALRELLALPAVELAHSKGEEGRARYARLVARLEQAYARLMVAMMVERIGSTCRGARAKPNTESRRSRRAV